MIKLNLKEISSAEKCSPNLLTTIKHELTIEDCEYYDSVGWKNYREDNHIETLLPTLGQPLYFHGNHDPIVIQIKGINYEFNFKEYSYEEPWKAEGKFITLLETDKPTTSPDSLTSHYRRSYYYKFFGQPTWVQGPIYPAYKGKPCYNLVTIENGWGDCGNYNILVGLDDDNIPAVAYFEASCC
jgi:hypothetical protein